MNLYDSITQSDLNDVIDLLLNNYHKEFSLNIDDSSNNYCTLEFDLSEGVDAGSEVIFNDGDELHISITDKRLALMGYTIRLYYYQLDKADYLDNKDYGVLNSFDVKLDSDIVDIPFTDNQVYLQKNFDLILLKDIGYRLLLNTSSTIVDYTDDVVLTADYTLGSVPVEDASVEFYNGETLIDTVDTDEDGLAVLTVSDLPMGSYNFSCVCNGVYSNTVNVSVGSDKVMELSVTGSSFSTYSNTPFTFNGRVFVDWGDDTGLIEYAGGKLTHTYSSSDDYTVKIYGEITSLGNNCFNSCTGLISIVIPSSITSLGNGCFTGCSNLYSIDLSENITSMGQFCFENCSNLTNMDLPNGIISLGYACFWGCSNLLSICIPDSVTSIGDAFLVGCPSLISVKFEWSILNEIVTYHSNWINVSHNCKFSIPNGTTSLYTAKGYPADKLVER